MVASNTASTRRTPLPVVVAAIASVVYLIGCLVFDRVSPEKTDFVNWVKIGEEAKLSSREHKAIMYDFSAAWCGPCHVLQREVFGDKRSAKTINTFFIPVKVVDTHAERGKNAPEVQKLFDRYKVEAFPTLVLTRAGSVTQRVHTGYSSRDEINSFLEKYEMDRLLNNKKVDLSWNKFDALTPAWKQSTKPLLILCWSDDAQISRNQYLSDEDLRQTVTDNFQPYELSIPTEPAKLHSPEAIALLKKLDYQHAPALIIVPTDGSAPHFQIGDTSALDNFDFLRMYLRSRSPEKKATTTGN